MTAEAWAFWSVVVTSVTGVVLVLVKQHRRPGGSDDEATSQVSTPTSPTGTPVVAEHRSKDPLETAVATALDSITTLLQSANATLVEVQIQLDQTQRELAESRSDLRREKDRNETYQVQIETLRKELISTKNDLVSAQTEVRVLRERFKEPHDDH